MTSGKEKKNSASENMNTNNTSQDNKTGNALQESLMHEDELAILGDFDN